MHDQMEQRLEELREQLELGEKRLRELEEERAELQQTMLRIAGAAQVLDELLAAETSNGAAPPEAVSA